MAGTRKTAVAVVLAALALTATACNNNDDKSAAPAAPTTAATSATPSAAAPTTAAKPEKVSPAVFLEQVTQKTGAAKSAKVDEVIQVGEVVMKGQGAVSWADGLEADLTMDLSGSPMAKLLEPLTGGPKVHYLYAKDAMYMGLGGQLLESGSPKWVRYSKADMAKASGGTTDQLQSADPVQGVRTLIASGKVTEVGQETVNGKATTHYSGVLSAADVLKATSQGMTQAQVDKIKQNLDTAGITTDQIDVWVDADKLVVKRSEVADTKAGALNVTVSYSDYGTPVIAATPADFIDLADLQKAAAGS
ncbi:hypothetical protein ACIQOV_25610 [Kitasatospora sp. NPDC091257]|uniref:hypothetical protein n=1 Tax=Kitasatospora sp. NPDC091257 TaxID=3364084 RepID=UPI0038280DE3